jgi:hypothetical protein
MSVVRDLLPKEHGTWAMLLVPWAIGTGVAGRLDIRQVLLLAAMVVALLLYTQVAAWFRLVRAPRPAPAALGSARRRTVALAVVATITGVPPILALPPGDVAVLAVITAGIGIAALLAVVARTERALAGQLLAPVGLAFSVVVAHAVGRRGLEPAAFALWALCALFFLGGVLYVRLKILALPRRASLGDPVRRAAFAAPTLGLEGLVLGLSALVVWWSPLSPLVLLGFATVAVQAVVGAARLHRPASLKRVGLISAIHSVVFAAAVILAA